MDTLILIIVGIGLLIFGIPALFLALIFYWILIPLIGAYFGGVLGFLFGVGLSFIFFVLKIVFIAAAQK